MTQKPPPLPGLLAHAPTAAKGPDVPRLEDLPAAASADPNCDLCDGTGIVVAPEAERAVATVCECLGECLRCSDGGRVIAIVDGAVRTGRCRCQLPADRARLFNAAHMPGRYADASFGSFMRGALRAGDTDKQHSLTSVTQWLTRFRPHESNSGLILYGAVGRGKTHLLVAILRDLALDKGVPVRFVEFTRLLSMLRAGFSEGRSGNTLMDELVAIPVLGIDELGKGRLTDWELTVIDELISRRYNAMACTLGTTNFHPGPATGAPPPNAALVDRSPQSLGDRIGDRVYSRVAEMGDFVEIGGIDYRDWRRTQAPGFR